MNSRLPVKVGGPFIAECGSQSQLEQTSDHATAAAAASKLKA